MFKNKDLALLACKLKTPLMTSSVINGGEQMNDDTRYTFHDDLSEKQPDTALLSIAVSAKFVVNQYIDQCTNLTILDMECDRIIEEYGDIWLKNARNQSVDADKVFDVLMNTAEDLEGLAELLEYNFHSLQNINEEAAELCDILQVQAKSHALIADTLIEIADAAAQKAIEEMALEKQTETLTSYKEENNVIQFRARRA